MNRIMTEVYPLLRMYQALAAQLMVILTDDDLAFAFGGDNPILGAPCRVIGEVQVSYIQSFTTFELDFAYRTNDPALQSSGAKLKTWFEALDQELSDTIAGLSDEEIQTKTIDHGGDFKLPPQIQLDVYKAALIIFYGKASVYLKALGKPRPNQ